MVLTQFAANNRVFLCNVSKEKGDQTVCKYVSQIGNQLMESMTADIYSFSEISRAFGINADPGSNIRYRQLDGSEY